MKYLEKMTGVGEWRVKCIFVLSIVGYPLISAIGELLVLDNRLLSVVYRSVIFCLSIFALKKTFFFRYSIRLFWIFWWVFWAMYLGRLAVDSTFLPESFSVSPYEYYAFAIGACLIPAIVFSFREVNFSDDIVFYLIFFGVLGILLNFFAFIFFYQNEYFSLFAGRLETKTLNPIAFGHLSVSVFCLACWALFSIKSKDFLYTIFLYFAIIISLMGLVASGSKGPLLSLLVIAILILLTSWRGLFYGTGAAVLLCISLLLNFNDTVFLQRALDGNFFNDDERIILINNAVEVFLDNFLLGAGIDPLESYPHNAILESFMALGLGGGLIFTYLFFYGFFCAIKLFIFRNKQWVAILFVQYAMFVLVSGSLYFVNVFWISLAAVVSMYLSKKERNPKFYGNCL